MKRSSFATVLTLPLLISCSGGGSLSDQLPAVLAPTVGLDAQHINHVPLATPGPAASGLLYVSNTGNNSITVYRDNATGDTAPLYTIGGPRTGISSPGQLAEDSQGNLYVANGSILSQSANPAVLVFAHGANGDVAPIRKLAGPHTSIHNVQAMTVDQSGGIFVNDVTPSDPFQGSLIRFAAGASGDVAPLARSAEDYRAVALTADSTGRNLIEAHIPASPNAQYYGIATYAKQFANGASLVDLFGIGAFGASGVADDPTTRSYWTTNGGIYRFAENTVGHGAIDNVLPATFAPAALGVITSDTCGSQLTLNAQRDIYVVHSPQAGCLSDAIFVYAPDSNGSVAPEHVLSGPATKLNAPYGVYAGK
jgi:hypothetical protein